jgi:hypothetical protein
MNAADEVVRDRLTHVLLAVITVALLLNWSATRDVVRELGNVHEELLIISKRVDRIHQTVDEIESRVP